MSTFTEGTPGRLGGGSVKRFIKIEAYIPPQPPGVFFMPWRVEEAVRVLWSEFSGDVMGPERMDLKVEDIAGVIRITGTVTSAVLHERMRNQIPRLLEIPDVAKVDVTGVSVHYPKP